jgi:hypothetical protein
LEFDKYICTHPANRLLLIPEIVLPKSTMTVFKEYTIRLLPVDRIRLTELAQLKGKKPRVFAREIIERYLDQQAIIQQKSR